MAFLAEQEKSEENAGHHAGGDQPLAGPKRKAPTAPRWAARVLAAAIAAGAVVIVTSNLDDFPAGALEPFGVEAKTPDDFVLDQISLNEGTVRDCVHQIARGRTRPPKTYEAVLNALERAGLVGAAAALRD